MKFGDPENPLLLSCRSGARQSMPGMMETVLNVGLCSKTIPGLVAKTKNERFVYDAYRRLIMMYSDVVMEKAEDIEPADGHGIRHQLEHIMAGLKKKKRYKSDTDMKVEDLVTIGGKLWVGAGLGKDGNIIRIVFPELSEERRREYIKIARHKAEDSRVSIRNIRRHAKDSLDKLVKGGEAGEDDGRRAERELEDLTHNYVGQIDDLLRHKETELLEV